MSNISAPESRFPWPALALILAPGAGAALVEKLEILPDPWGVLAGLTGGLLVAVLALAIGNRPRE